MNTLKVWAGVENLKSDDVILGGGSRNDDGWWWWGRGVKNGRKSDDVINGRPLISFIHRWQGRSDKTFSGQPTLEKYPPTPTHLLLSMWFLNCPWGMKGFLRKRYWNCKKLQHSFPHSCKKIRQNRHTSKSRPAHGLAGLACRYSPKGGSSNCFC